MSFKITDNGKGAYRVALLADPSVFRDAETYGLAEAYGAEMVQWQQMEARNAVYDRIDEERLLEQANALMAKRRGRPRKIAIVDEEPAPIDEEHAA